MLPHQLWGALKAQYITIRACLAKPAMRSQLLLVEVQPPLIPLPFILIPEIDSRHSEVMRVGKQLAIGKVTQDFNISARRPI